MIAVDSEETVAEAGQANLAFDGNPSTHWVTQWFPTNSPQPHSITADLGGAYRLCALDYLPRQDGGTNGTILDYEIETSVDGVIWTSAGSGRFNPAAGTGPREVQLDGALARFVRMRSLSSANAGPWASAAEISFDGVISSGPNAPSLRIVEPDAAPLVAPGAVLDLVAEATDVEDPAPEILWDFPPCMTPTTTSGPVPGPVVVSCAPGVHPIEIHACDDDGMCADDELRVTVADGGCAPLAPSEWSLLHADSEEIYGENGRASRAFDGDPTTSWVTGWTGVASGLPHVLHLDLGSTRVLCALGYLPRQDGGDNGTVRDYELATSRDGEHWTVASRGSLVESVLDLSERRVTFDAVAARYIRFTAESEVEGGPWTTVAELTIEGAPALPELGGPLATIDAANEPRVIVPGEILSFHATGVPVQPGLLPASALNWTVLLHHCADGPYDCHLHLLDEIAGVDAGAIVTPEHGWYSFIEFVLEANDDEAGGLASLSRQARVPLDPLGSELTFQSVPPGLQLVLGSSTQTAPFTQTLIPGSNQSLAAPSPQSLAGASYAFQSWSQGGPANQQFTAPVHPMTFTATFVPTGACSSPDNTCNGFDDDCDGDIDEDTPLPVSSVVLEVHHEHLHWSEAADATGYDVVTGNLALLRSTGSWDGVASCLADDLAATEIDAPPDPAPGGAVLFLVRGTNCVGSASWNASGPRTQVGRDLSITVCP